MCALDTDGWRSARVRVDVPVTINAHQAGTAIDVSDSGMYVYSRHSVMQESIVNISFTLDGQPIDLSARVAHSQHGVGFGVRFLDMPDAVSGFIKTYIKKAEREGRVLKASGPQDDMFTTITDGWRSVRVRVDVPVTINRHQSGTAIDLSNCGMYVYTRHAVLQESIVNISFTLEGHPIELAAHVAHSQQGIGFGVRFLDMPDSVEEILKAYIIKAESERHALLKSESLLESPDKP